MAKGKHVKLYYDIQEMIDDGVITPYEIVIIWAKRGKGKSSLMGKFMSDFMKPGNAAKRLAGSNRVCELLNEADIYITPPDDHTVFCDTFFEDNGFQGNKHRPYEISGLDIGLPNKKHKVLPVLPYACVFLDEIQDLYDSHIGSLPSFLSKWFELSRQIGVFMCMACQRPIRVVKDIRDIATFFEVVGMENMYIRNKLVSTVWTINIIYDNAKLEQYLESKDESLIDKTIQVMFRGDIFSCYDPNYFMPMFYRGFEGMSFQWQKVERTEFTREGFERYNSKRIIDIPETFRGKTPKTPQTKETKT